VRWLWMSYKLITINYKLIGAHPYTELDGCFNTLRVERGKPSPYNYSNPFF
jgi:hypothetical protein